MGIELQPELRFPEFDEEWVYKVFGEIVTNKSRKFNPKTNDQDVRCIELEHIAPDTGNLLGYTTTLDITSTKNIFDKGDVLYGKLRPYLNKYHFTKFNGVCSSEIWVLKGIDVDNKFLSNLIQTPYYKYITLKTTGSKMPRADWNVISETEFCITSNSLEQQKIADYLSTIDRKITLLEEKKVELTRYKKSMMQKLFSQELRFKDENGKDFEDWEIKLLREISHKPKYGLNSSSVKYDGINGYIRITDINETSNKFIRDGITSPLSYSDDFLLREGDLLFTRTGASTGKSYLYDPKDGKLFFAGFLIKFSLKRNCDSRFVFFQTQTSHYKKWVKKMSMRSGQPGINSEEYSTFEILFPSLPEQQKIADFLSAIDESINKVEEQVQQTTLFKKAMLQQMFV